LLSDVLGSFEEALMPNQIYKHLKNKKVNWWFSGLKRI